MTNKIYHPVPQIISIICGIFIILAFISSCASYSSLRSESLTLHEQGKNEEALEKLEEAMEMSPGLKEDYLLKSKILEKLGRKEEAGIAIGEYQNILDKLLEDLRVINNELEIKKNNVELYKQKLALLQQINDENNDKSKEIEELQKQLPLIEIENDLAQVENDLENDPLNLKLWKQKQELLLKLDRKEEAEEVANHIVEVEKELSTKKIEDELAKVDEQLAENPGNFTL